MFNDYNYSRKVTVNVNCLGYISKCKASFNLTVPNFLSHYVRKSCTNQVSAYF